MTPDRAPDYQEIYANHADRYDLLISREDFESNIPRALSELVPAGGKDVVELGAGTGRLTRLLAPSAGSIHALDISPHMLEVAASQLRQTGLRNWTVLAADHRGLPLLDQTADIVISGWSMVYLVVWNQTEWISELNKGLNEAKRVLRPGGSIIILETLGTGQSEPNPPVELLDYYAHLEEQGFASSWIRTDYLFESREEADDIVSFFFGEEMLVAIVENGSVTLPECTGIWWRTF